MDRLGHASVLRNLVRGSVDSSAARIAPSSPVVTPLDAQLADIIQGRRSPERVAHDVAQARAAVDALWAQMCQALPKQS